jgi:hypothetical protein
MTFGQRLKLVEPICGDHDSAMFAEDVDVVSFALHVEAHPHAAIDAALGQRYGEPTLPDVVRALDQALLVAFSEELVQPSLRMYIHSR